MDSLNKLEYNQYVSIQEIKRLKVQELKMVLSDHGQPVMGKKADLVHGFLVSFSSVSWLFLDPFLSKWNTTFTISPLLTKKLQRKAHAYRVIASMLPYQHLSGEFETRLHLIGQYEMIHLVWLPCVTLVHCLAVFTCCIFKESVCTTFGCGLSSACVVDVGDEKSSICCVEEGLVIPSTR